MHSSRFVLLCTAAALSFSSAAMAQNFPPQTNCSAIPDANQRLACDTQMRSNPQQVPGLGMGNVNAPNGTPSRVIVQQPNGTVLQNGVTVQSGGSTLQSGTVLQNGATLRNGATIVTPNGGVPVIIPPGGTGSTSGGVNAFGFGANNGTGAGVMTGAPAMTGTGATGTPMTGGAGASGN